ncbi:putative RNA cytidine acetyltransferase [Blattamonas nauphoetae]|uniref:RNA cytidine acetyltransferase n=1 Tax=Blattamonas nauphoetae TaxID=2049346 RepID=A0ABQ9YCJ6_9EUKA|nr:putative RNA cytidine acetyltransferase [Blattamonas nauphoetae]
MKKKIDERIRILIENGVKSNHRSFFVIVGDRGKDQVVNLHYILSHAAIKARPNVLWCYKKELALSSNKRKRMRQLKRMTLKGLIDKESDNPFELFVSSTQIRWCYYAESHQILGQTFGMCILQDFESVTPNLLARTVETVEGGGIFVILLQTMTSLRQLYSMTMDVHSRFKTSSGQTVVPRFNERFILSLAACQSCLIVDDELNILPISHFSSQIKPLALSDIDKNQAREQAAISEIESQASTVQLGSEESTKAMVGILKRLLPVSKTKDQCSVLFSLLQQLSSTYHLGSTTVSVTASRGRGKSAAMGLAIAGAVGFGYSSIVVTAPSPHNVGTVFEFVERGLKALGMNEHGDYEVSKASFADMPSATVSISCFKTHQQKVQFVSALADQSIFQSADLVVVDEAAAIPLPIVRKIVIESGQRMVFVSSTVSGYEGTGRSLTLKLMKELRTSGIKAKTPETQVSSHSSNPSRNLVELSLTTPIRYSAGDDIEAWLESVLCMSSATLNPDNIPPPISPLPRPEDCELFLVNRDTLFSFHRASELFLQNLMSLFVSSHYRNSPNDLQLLSDAPSHQVFVLCPPISKTSNKLPEIICAVQLCLEGQISKHVVASSLTRGSRAAGDLIPWTLSTQFQDPAFATLSGARVVRIATDERYQRMGYGERVLKILTEFLSGNLYVPPKHKSKKKTKTGFEVEEGRPSVEAPTLERSVLISKQKRTDLPTPEDTKTMLDADNKVISKSVVKPVTEDIQSALQTEDLAPRPVLPPLLTPLSEIQPREFHWFGTAFGLTLSLFHFWQKAGLLPLYIRQSANELTGEYTCIMLKQLHTRTAEEGPAEGVESDWVGEYSKDFTNRLCSLLSFEFTKFSIPLALSLVVANNPTILKKGAGEAVNPPTSALTQWASTFSSNDKQRIASYSSGLIDYHLVIDLVPRFSQAVFGRIVDSGFSAIQLSLLVGIGLQRKSLDGVAAELSANPSILLSHMQKLFKKMNSVLKN